MAQFRDMRIDLALKINSSLKLNLEKAQNTLSCVKANILQPLERMVGSLCPGINILGIISLAPQKIPSLP